ncbi:MAG: class I SAM-dependent methyltransferase [Planctomycetota bacterium]|nr:class I SAM-dependent methyltransferase [Planctomycetota bacterium]
MSTDMAVIYDRMYGKGKGWSYDPDRESAMIRELVVKPTKLPQWSRILEVGCGEGVHANALRKRSMHVTAVDISPVAVKHAKTAYTFASLDFLHRDAADLTAEFLPGRFDMLYCRGLSWHHYALADAENGIGVNPVKATAGLVSLVKNGGFFCLQICTDFSGQNGPGVWKNALKTYVSFMERFGKIVHCSDWWGQPIKPTARKTPSGTHGGLIITIQTPKD